MGKFPPDTPEKKTAEAVRLKGEFMKKTEKNYSRDSLKEELDNVLETVNPDDLTADEKCI